MRLSLVLLPLLYGVAGAQTTSSHLFLAHEPLVFRLETDFRALTRDRGTQRKEHPAVLHYGVDSDTGTIAVKLRTRGIFRLKTCSFPPIRLDLPKHDVAGTPFEGEDRLKLVTHCQGSGFYEHNLLREYALYRAFNAVTDSSFRVRLARITYIDSARHDSTTRYGFLIESDTALGMRMEATPLRSDHLYDPIMDPAYMTLVAVFEYLIGNNDWSVRGRHNMAVFQKTTDSKPLLAVPYDFDFSGAVNAPYASPPPQVPIKTVRQRFYRGFCKPDTVMMAVVARFQAAQDQMYANVRAVPDLPQGDVRNMLGYFDDFYDVLKNRNAVNREFMRNCRAVVQ